jgi:hypothetical protein
LKRFSEMVEIQSEVFLQGTGTGTGTGTRTGTKAKEESEEGSEVHV